MLNLSIVTGNRIADKVKEAVPEVPTTYLICGIFHLGVMAFGAFFLNPKPPSEKAEASDG